jgi:hypothetical protein
MSRASRVTGGSQRAEAYMATTTHCFSTPGPARNAPITVRDPSHGFSWDLFAGHCLSLSRAGWHRAVISRDRDVQSGALFRLTQSHGASIPTHFPWPMKRGVSIQTAMALAIESPNTTHEKRREEALTPLFKWSSCPPFANFATQPRSSLPVLPQNSQYECDM